MHRLEYAGVRLLSGVFRAMPIEWASWTMGKAFRAFAPLTHRHRRSLDHLALALPKTSEAERRRIAREMWENLGRVAGEQFHIDRLLAARDRVRLSQDFDHYAKLGADGAVIASLHLGNWEIAAMGAAIAKFPVAGVYHPLRNPLVERYLRGLRLAAYPGGLLPKGAGSGRRLIAHAKRGGAVGFIADVRELRGVAVTFFGQPAFATPMPAMMARLSDVPIIACAMVRTGGVRFELTLCEVAVPRTTDRDADVRAGTQALHDVFEAWIRETPEQWMWSHRKWALDQRPRTRRAAASLAPSEPAGA
jgi:KDO2-lipid IV(A) lauroyltransferase